MAELYVKFRFYKGRVRNLIFAHFLIIKLHFLTFFLTGEQGNLYHLKVHKKCNIFHFLSLALETLDSKTEIKKIGRKCANIRFLTRPLNSIILLAQYFKTQYLIFSGIFGDSAQDEEKY